MLTSYLKNPFLKDSVAEQSRTPKAKAAVTCVQGGMQHAHDVFVPY